MLNPMPKIPEFDRAQWFSQLRREYSGAVANSAYLQHELKLLDERHQFSFYSGMNPMWLMDHSERAGMYMALSLSRPAIIIEIGARFAGTTALFSQVAERVYVIDIDPGVRDRCKPLGNVTVMIGNSSDIIPDLIDRLNIEHGGWDFALVDGDHSSAGVRNDLNALIGRRPKRRSYVTMHDSFNPECRKGILQADWDHPWVHAVEVDFTIGNIMPQPHVFGEMWGGLALAELSDIDREGPMRMTQTGQLTFEAAVRNQALLKRRPIHIRIASRLARLVALSTSLISRKAD
jgi:cephalosporin hydroxylase